VREQSCTGSRARPGRGGRGGAAQAPVVAHGLQYVALRRADGAPRARSDEVVLVSRNAVDAARFPTETTAGDHDRRPPIVFAVAPRLGSTTRGPRCAGRDGMLAMLRPKAGERVVDLSQVSALASFLADAVGAREGSSGGGVAAASHDARRTAARRPGRARTVEGCRLGIRTEPLRISVGSTLRERVPVAPSWEQIVDRAPRAVAYVACTPPPCPRPDSRRHGYGAPRAQRLRPLPD